MESVNAAVADATKVASEAMNGATGAANDAVKAGTEKVQEAFGSPAATPNKTLDFGLGTATPSTPVTLPSLSKDDVDYDAFIKDTIMWKLPVRSIVYLLGGLAVITAACYVFNSETPLLSVFCYVILAQMFLNFCRVVMDPKLQERATYADSAYTQWAIKQVTAGVRTMAAVHDSHCMSLQPWKTLQIIVGLWITSILARYTDFFTLLAVLYALAFIVPKLYVIFKSKIDPVVEDIYGKVMKQFNEMDLRLKAALIIVPVLLLGYLSSRIDMVIAAFVVLAYARTQFRDADVAKGVQIVSDKTKPIQKAASQIGTKVSGIVEDFVDKHELTPTPMKKKTN